jgi:hypothetical protein
MAKRVKLTVYIGAGGHTIRLRALPPTGSVTIEPVDVSLGLFLRTAETLQVLDFIEATVLSALELGLSESVTPSDAMAASQVMNASLEERVRLYDVLKVSGITADGVAATDVAVRAWWNRTYLGGSVWWRYPGRGR